MLDSPDPGVANRLSLVHELTRLVPQWCAWKGIDRALEGQGDIDSAAPQNTWAEVTRLFAAWAVQKNYGQVVVCDHFPGVRFLITDVSSDRPFMELDICDVQLFRGAALFTARQLAPLHRMDERGFRRLLPGAEATLVLLLKHCRLLNRAGKPSRELRSMMQDEVGLLLTARTLDIPAQPLQRLAHDVIQGRWSRYDALLLQVSQLKKIPSNYRLTGERVLLRLRGISQCSVMQSVLREDRIVRDPNAWWSVTRQEHVVLTSE